MFKVRKSLLLLVGAGAIVVGSLGLVKAEKASKMGDIFFIFADRGSRLNHYTPSGWMGDYGDLKINNSWTKDVEKPAKKMTKNDKAAEKMKKEAGSNEDTCLQIKYTGERKQGAGWAGVYWQHPANNWGDKRGGFDLSQYTKLTFWAKGEVGEEIVDKFFIGDIAGQTEEGDSDAASISPVQLTKEWEKYTINLEGLDLSHIIGGFGFAANADANPDGFIAYVDEIRLEK